MPAERKLIDTAEFYSTLEAIRMEYIEEDTKSSDFAAEVIETVQDEYLAKAPAVDAEEVVRCKDCKRSRESRTNLNLCWCNRFDNVMRSSDFCSYGERRPTDG